MPPLPPLAKRVGVEPLDAERLARVERAVVLGATARAPARAAPRWLGFAAALGVTALAAGVCGWLVHDRAAAPAATAELAPLRVRTDASAATLDIGDATIASSAAAAFDVTRPGGGVLVELSRGRLELEVGKRGARPPLVVRARDTDVIVVGTHFTVDAGDGQGEVRVRVSEGRVRVVRQQHETFVASGEAWSSAGGLVAVTELPGAGSASPAPAAGSDAGATIGALPGGDRPGGGSGSGVTVALGPGPKVLHDRTSVVPDAHPDAAHAPAPRPAAADSVPGRNGEVLSRGAKTWIEARADDPHQIRPAIRQVPLRPALDVGTADAARAASEYLKKINDKDQGSMAMYSLAVVRHIHLGDNPGALALVDAYVRRFLHGPELADMLWLQVRILCMDRKLDAACHAAAQTYLDRAPGGAGAHVAELITLTE